MNRATTLLLTVLALLLIVPASADAARVPLPQNVTIINAGCPDESLAACADTTTDTIYLPDGDRFDRYHELGHLYDAQKLTDTDRAWFTRAMRMTPGPWDRGTGNDCLGVECPSEWFADAYAKCALNMNPAGFRKRNGVIVQETVQAYGYLPGPRMYRQVCNGIAVLGLVR